MDTKYINILVNTFPGLGLPSTLCLPIPAASSVPDFLETLRNRLPLLKSRILISTLTNKYLTLQTPHSIASFLSSPDDAFLHLRLSACLCGGKGGFGSQLRAAGGRMSSRKKRKQGEEHASSRNLDGRRLRTVTEAKALAEYLAVKPEMDRKEKEEKRKRWEQVIELAERKEDEVKHGSRSRLDGGWVEAKEDVMDKTREAVLLSLKSGEIKALLSKSESDQSGTNSDALTGSESETEAGGSTSAEDSKDCAPRTFYGWDEEDTEMSDDASEDVKMANVAADEVPKGKGKERRTTT